MKLARLRAPAGLENVDVAEASPPKPRAGEVLGRIRAMLLRGKVDFADGRVPLSDGAGEVIAVGAGVEDLRTVDAVVSTFWPYWLAGEMAPAGRREIPGETVDGYAREYACMPAHFFTKAPPGLTHVESATLPCAGVTAWRALVTAVT